MFDPKCYELANHFLPVFAPDSVKAALAQDIQDTVEGFLAEPEFPPEPEPTKLSLPDVAHRASDETAQLCRRIELLEDALKSLVHACRRSGIGDPAEIPMAVQYSEAVLAAPSGLPRA